MPPDRPPAQRRMILVMEQHPLLCEAFAEVVNSRENLFCCGMASNLGEVLRIVSSRRPDLVLLSLPLAYHDGIETIQALQTRPSQLRIIVVTSSREATFPERARAAGALACLPQDQTVADLFRAIQMAVAEEMHHESKTAKSPRGESRQVLLSPRMRMDELTLREMLFYRCILTGHPLDRIAAALDLNLKDASRLQEHIEGKLGLPRGRRLPGLESWEAGEANLPLDVSTISIPPHLLSRRG